MVITIVLIIIVITVLIVVMAIIVIIAIMVRIILVIIEIIWFAELVAQGSDTDGFLPPGPEMHANSISTEQARAKGIRFRMFCCINKSRRTAPQEAGEFLRECKPERDL